MAFDIVQNIVHLVNSERGQWKGVRGRKKFKKEFSEEPFDDDFKTGISLQFDKKTGNLDIVLNQEEY